MYLRCASLSPPLRFLSLTVTAPFPPPTHIHIHIHAQVDLAEFSQAVGLLRGWGITVDEEHLEAEFNAVDLNGGGQILFVEFCDWALNRHLRAEYSKSGSKRGGKKTKNIGVSAPEGEATAREKDKALLARLKGDGIEEAAEAAVAATAAAAGATEVVEAAEAVEAAVEAIETGAEGGAATEATAIAVTVDEETKTVETTAELPRTKTERKTNEKTAPLRPIDTVVARSPLHGEVHAPSTFVPQQQQPGPSRSLELEFVHGYQGQDMFNNVFVIYTGEVSK